MALGRWPWGGGAGAIALEQWHLGRSAWIALDQTNTPDDDQISLL
jgi:hypothetical protein